MEKPQALSRQSAQRQAFTAINFIYRLIKFAGARRVLFLVDRGNMENGGQCIENDPQS
jgi:type I restriction enzyme R subunit